MKKIILGSAMITAMILGGIAAMLMLTQYQEIIPEQPDDIQPVEPRKWENIPIGAWGNPGTGNSGVMEIFIYNHSADALNTYNTNLSADAAACYGNSSSLNSSAGVNIPYDTAFDIVLACRLNTTHLWNSTGSYWMFNESWTPDRNWICANITSADLDITAQNMSGIHVSNTTDYIFINFYINQSTSGSPLNITHGELINVTSFQLKAYY